MYNYALYHNRYKSAAFQLIADDDVRDYGHPEKGPELRQQWEDMGFHVISMHDDWKTIYGENVVRTGEIHWYEDYADDKISEKQAVWLTFWTPLNARFANRTKSQPISAQTGRNGLAFIWQQGFRKLIERNRVTA